MVFEKRLTIKKGKHKSDICFPFLFWGRELNFQFNFETSPMYTIPSKYKKDTQKIFGISDGIHHHRHSVRIGWRKIDRFKIEFLCYYYVDGINNIKSLGIYSLKNSRKRITGKITIRQHFYFIDFDDKKTAVPRKSKWFGPRYLLFPFFGDKTKQGTKAPHNFRIKIKWGFKDLETMYI